MQIEPADASLLQALDSELMLELPPTATQIFVHLGDSHAHRVASFVDRFDREVRRTAAEDGRTAVDWLYLSDKPEEPRVPTEWSRALREYDSGDRDNVARRRRLTRPDPPDRSGLELLAARPGSSNVLFDVVGTAIDAFTWAPLSALLNAYSVVAIATTVRVWARARAHRDGGAEGPGVLADGEERITVLSQTDGDPTAVLGVPDHQLAVTQVALPDGTNVRTPSRVTLVRDNPDGTQTVIVIDAVSRP
jgi:hypothetical protein